MRLTRYTDYSLRVLMYVGIQLERPVTMTEVAQSHRISRNHVMKVVYELGQLGYLKTSRGKNGGIELGRNPDQINIGQLIRETENNLEIVECFGNDNHCPITPACILKRTLSQALSAFFDVLDQYTLADLITPKSDLQKLLSANA